jgi:hypothetical protein
MRSLAFLSCVIPSGAEGPRVLDCSLRRLHENDTRSRTEKGISASGPSPARCGLPGLRFDLRRIILRWRHGEGGRQHPGNG